MVYRSVFVVACAFSVVVGHGQSRLEKIEEIMARYNEYGQFNGLVLVAEEGKVVYKRAFGKANIEWDIPNSFDTKMEIASITKTFTALMIMQMVEKGKVSLDGKISDYIKEYPKEAGSRITIDQLLRHSSGLQQDIADFPPNRNDFPDIVAKINEEFYSLEEQVEIISKRPLLFDPGSKFGYSSDGYAVLGLVLERVTGLSYEDALHMLILDPLQLNDTGYKDHLAIVPKRAQGYAKTFAGVKRGRQIGINPAGGMFSTIYDLLKWEQALYTDRVITRRSKDIVFSKTPYVVAYGWQISNNYFNTEKDSIKMVRCTGSLPGFNSLVVRFPEYNKTIIVMENLKQPFFKQFEIVQTVACVLFGHSYELPKRSLAEALLIETQNKGERAALEFYNRSKVTNEYYISEAEINALGYHLLYNEGKVDEALAILKLNTELFPDSANTYDSLAEAYLVKGERQNALRFYRKSLELDPTNQNAKSHIDKLTSNN